MPGASLLVSRLKQYSESVGGQIEVHLVDHSAGAIFTAHLLTRLAEADLPVASISWLAPAIRIDAFEEIVLPRLRDGAVTRFASSGLNDSMELDTELVWSPCESPPRNRCSARAHGGMDTDVSTMTSVLLRILGASEPTPESTFRPYSSPRPHPAGTGARSGGVSDAQTVGVEPPGEAPVTRTGESQSTYLIDGST